MSRFGFPIIPENVIDGDPSLPGETDVVAVHHDSGAELLYVSGYYLGRAGWMRDPESGITLDVESATKLIPFLQRFIASGGTSL